MSFDMKLTEKRCPNCDGSGVIDIPHREYDPRRWCSCPTCGGKGVVSTIKARPHGNEGRSCR